MSGVGAVGPRPLALCPRCLSLRCSVTVGMEVPPQPSPRRCARLCPACSPRPVASGLPCGSGGGNKVFPQRGPRSLPAPHAQVTPGARSAEPPGQPRTVPQADAAADLRVWALGEAVSREGCRRPPLLLMSERCSLSQPPPSATATPTPWLAHRTLAAAQGALHGSEVSTQQGSPRSPAPRLPAPARPCSPGLRITPEPECTQRALTAEGAGQAGPAPGLDSLATGSSVTGQSRGPGCLSPLQLVQQRQGESYERLCQSCQLPGRAAGHPQTSALLPRPPPPSKPAADLGQKDKDSMGKQELQAWGSGHGIIVTGTGMRAGWGSCGAGAQDQVAGRGAGAERAGASGLRWFRPRGCKSFHDGRQVSGQEDGLHSDVSAPVPGRRLPAGLERAVCDKNRAIAP